ncbi:MAG: hypothetical protein RLZZ444_2109 [Pseudomonadota bacterium]
MRSQFDHRFKQGIRFEQIPEPAVPSKLRLVFALLDNPHSQPDVVLLEDSGHFQLRPQAWQLSQTAFTDSAPSVVGLESGRSRACHAALRKTMATTCTAAQLAANIRSRYSDLRRRSRLLNFGFDRGNLGRAGRPANLHSPAIAEHQIDAGACGSNNSATGDHHQNDDLHAAADEVSGDLALAWYSLAQFSPSLPNLTRLAPPTEVQHLHAEATV